MKLALTVYGLGLAVSLAFLVTAYGLIEAVNLLDRVAG